jgi:lysylphosphatidylglycerol synthetase-like protein (DUF2156 family)
MADVALLVVMTRYALTSRKHWPVWFAGIHTAGVLFGIAALFFSEGERLILDYVSAFWAIPALIVMVLGLLADRRGGIVNETS